MAFLTEMALGFGRAIASTLKGESNAILLSLKFLEELDDPETGASSTEEPMYCSLGTYGRPKPPARGADASAASNPEGETEVLAWSQEDRTYAFAYRDLRLNALTNPKEGEVGLVQYNGGMIAIKTNDDGDGSDMIVYCPRGPLNSIEKAHAISLATAADNLSISIMHADGHSIALTKDGDVMLTSANGENYVQVNDSGVTLNGGALNITGGLDVGGGGVTPGEPVMLSIQMLAWIAQVNTAIGNLTAHTHAVTAAPGTTGPPTPAPVAPVAVPVASTKLNAGL